MFNLIAFMQGTIGLHPCRKLKQVLTAYGLGRWNEKIAFKIFLTPVSVCSLLLSKSKFSTMLKLFSLKKSKVFALREPSAVWERDPVYRLSISFFCSNLPLKTRDSVSSVSIYLKGKIHNDSEVFHVKIILRTQPFRFTRFPVYALIQIRELNNAITLNV